MAINPLQIPGYGSSLDITPQLSQFAATLNQGAKQRTLADIGKGLSDGTLDYRAAAGRVASLGDLNETLKFLALAEAKDKQAKELAASQQFNSGLGNLFGPNASSAAIGGPAVAGPTIPNDSNAFPGQAGMDARLADRSQDFIQDNPGTYLSSGVRSTADQARLYAGRSNNPNPVAAPGTSRHERGLAIDIGGMTPDQRAMLPQYGLGQPVANDPPHVELAANERQQPTQVAQAGGTFQLSAAHIPMLINAMSNPNLPAPQKEMAKVLLTRALDESKTPEKSASFNS